MFSCPNKAKQMVRYYGYYSNVSRGKRHKENQADFIAHIMEPNGSSKEYMKNWARLIQKIYELAPFSCPKCQGRMRIIAFIADPEVIKKILKHLDLCNLKARPQFTADAPPKSGEQWLDYSDSQLPSSYDYLFVDERYCKGFSA